MNKLQFEWEYLKDTEFIEFNMPNCNFSCFFYTNYDFDISGTFKPTTAYVPNQIRA